MSKFKSINPIEIYLPRSNIKYFNGLLHHIGLNEIDYQLRGKGYKITHLVITDRVWLNPQELSTDKCSKELIDLFEQIENKKLDKVQSKLSLIEFFLKSQF